MVDDRRPGLGAEFLDELERVVGLVTQRPRSFPRLKDPAAGLEVRRALLPRFPYAVAFMEMAEEIRILAVCHSARRPGYWLDRVEP